MKRFHHLFLITTFLCSSFIFAAGGGGGAAPEKNLDPLMFNSICQALENFPLREDQDTATSQELVDTDLNLDTAESYHDCERVKEMFLKIINERVRSLPKGDYFEGSSLLGEVYRWVDEFFTTNSKKGFDREKDLKNFCIQIGAFIRDSFNNIQRSSKGTSNNVFANSARIFFLKRKQPVLLSATTECTPRFLGSLENLDFLLKEGFLTMAQHHHFQEVSNFVSKDFLENLQLNLSFVLSMNLNLFSKNINLELIRSTFDRASVFRNSIIFYAQKDKKLLKIRHYNKFLNSINNSNVEERIAHFYTTVLSGGSEFQVEYKASYEDTGSIKDSEILEEYPFLKHPVEVDLLRAVIVKLAKNNFISERQTARFSKKIEKSLEAPQLLILVMREAFKQASIACTTAKETTLADDLETAVMLHFNNKNLYRELGGPDWIARIQENRDNEAALKNIDDEMYALLAETPEPTPIQKTKKSRKKKK